MDHVSVICCQVPLHVLVCGMAKDARLDMRISSELKEALLRCAEKERRRLTDLVEIILTDHVADCDPKPPKRK